MSYEKKAGRLCLRLSGAILILSLLASCASTLARRETGYTPEIGERAAKTALSMIGRPYRYRGDTPSGFDCSGLVRYSYLTAGLELPHGTKALKSMSRPVGRFSARKGDLVFFNERGGKYSHVGLYLGHNRFVHAPSTGERVREDSLDDPYWKKHYLDTRRLM